jgi:hypothetical protein
MFKRKFDLNALNISQNNIVGVYKSFSDQEKINELLNSFNLTQQQQQECLIFINLLSSSDINNIKVNIEKWIFSYNARNKSESNIEKLLENSNINELKDTNIHFVPKLLSPELLEILDAIIQKFEVLFPNEYNKKEFDFLIRICLNDEKLLKLVDEFIDSLQNEKVVVTPILDRLEQIKKEFLKTKNYLFQSDASSIANLDDQTKLLKDVILFTENSLNESLPKELFLALYLFQVDAKTLVKDNKINVNSDYELMKSVRFILTGKDAHKDIEPNYLPMNNPQNKKSETNPDYENSKFLNNLSQFMASNSGKDSIKNKSFTNLPTCSDLSVQSRRNSFH